MKKTIITILIIIGVLSHCFSQTDKCWKLGYFTQLDFKTLPPQIVIDTTPACMDDASTSISDNNGDLLFYTSGFEVYNKVGGKMPNGKNFNAGLYSSPYYTTTGCYPQIKSSTFIPFANNTNKYYLLYENMQYKDYGNNYLPDKLRFLTIDKTLNNGLGDVVIKDSILISSDTIEGGSLLSFKHADGVSYWVLARKYHSNKFYRFLIDSFGIHRLADQSIGNAYIDSFSILGISNTSYNNDKVAYVYQSYHTSPNLKPGQIDILDFDRCKGMLYNYKKINLIYSVDTVYAVSVCFSPNNNYLYATDQRKLWQFDLQSSNIYNSKIIVGKRNSGETYIFWQMRNAFDGKIYLSNGGDTRSIHVINAPDSLGLACNFVQKQIQIPTTGFYYSNGGLPNEPNFALGKLNCPLGIEEINQNGFSIYPNPASQSIVISHQSLVNTIEIMDVLGRVCSIPPLQGGKGDFSINIENLPSGFYFLKAIDEKGKVYNSKFVKE